MINNIKIWIEKNPFPFALIVAVTTVILTLGVIYGVGYLQFQEIEEIEQDVQNIPDRAETIGVTYHHTATPDRSFLSHHLFHRDTRGWLGLGYNYGIREDGEIEQGRPMNARGAHEPTANNSHVGVAFSGNFNESEPTEAQYKAGAELHVWLEEQYGKELEVTFHRDFAGTSCPGDNFNEEKFIKMIEEERKYREELDKNDNDVDIIVDDEVIGEILGQDSMGYLINDRTYVPIREISETLGYDVNWDAENRFWEVKEVN